MQLSLSEAARLLGKSDRQVRYLIRTGKLQARKKDGRWIIQRDDLPLSPDQERAARQKTERAARLANDILENAQGKKKPFSIRQTRAVEKGAPLYHDLTAALGAEHPAAALLHESLMLLACGFHEYESSPKADFYARARHHASRATMTLLLDDPEAHAGLIERLESDYLPIVGGLIQHAEGRGRRR